MERPSAEEVRRAGKALALGVALGVVLLALARRNARERNSPEPAAGSSFDL